MIERIWIIEVMSKQEDQGQWITFAFNYDIPPWCTRDSNGFPLSLQLTPEEFASVKVGDRLQITIMDL